MTADELNLILNRILQKIKALPEEHAATRDEAVGIISILQFVDCKYLTQKMANYVREQLDAAERMLDEKFK